MDHEVVPCSPKTCDWALNLFRTTLVYIKGKRTEWPWGSKSPKSIFSCLHYPLSWFHEFCGEIGSRGLFYILDHDVVPCSPKNVIGRWTCPGTTLVYIKGKRIKWPWNWSFQKTSFRAYIIHCHGSMSFVVRHGLRGCFTPWTMKLSLVSLKYMIGRWTCPGTALVYIKGKRIEWPWDWSPHKAYFWAYIIHCHGPMSFVVRQGLRGCFNHGTWSCPLLP